MEFATDYNLQSDFLEDYLIYSKEIDLETGITNKSLKMSNGPIYDSDGVPMRSPARVKNIPDLPDIMLDTSSLEYHSYGSDRSSQMSIFSDAEEPKQSEEFQDAEIELIIDMSEGEDEEILEQCGYFDSFEVKKLEIETFKKVKVYKIEIKN